MCQMCRDSTTSPLLEDLPFEPNTVPPGMASCEVQPIASMTNVNISARAHTTLDMAESKCDASKGSLMKSLHNNIQSRNTLRFVNRVLASVHSVQPSQVCLDEQVNQDILIRGVMQGWVTLQNQEHLCPLWEILREIDERIFYLGGVLTRICMLRMVHLLLRVSV